ncbi:hypothetical protein F9K50_04330 [bacterium]|nr:MAG: hypothetical protein F9K50_04330 [bacterium]
MTPQDSNEKPLTVLQLTAALQEVMPGILEGFYEQVLEPRITRLIDERQMEFYTSYVEPRFQKIIDERQMEFYTSHVEPRFQKMLRIQLASFYDDYIELRVDDKISTSLQEFRNEMNMRFDDLYKKFEDLQQEYVFSNHHLRRLDLRLEGVEKRLSLVENHLRRLKPPLNS